ncbi:MAG TPA: hypothetical protein VFU92_00175 [Usitatibacter sp.]|nr:hypothetical protein [Usitatibacter sp.]
MNRAILVALGTGAIISSAAAFTAGGVGDEGPAITQQQYGARLRAIASERGAHEARCDGVAGFERELCRIEAAANESVHMAEAEAAFRRTQQSARAALRARIDARYQMDRAKCGALGGFKRDKCLVQVHATRGRAMLAAAQPYEVRF